MRIDVKDCHLISKSTKPRKQIKANTREKGKISERKGVRKDREGANMK